MVDSKFVCGIIFLLGKRRLFNHAMIFGQANDGCACGIFLAVALFFGMLNEFIEKILVHERDRKGSIQTTQEVEIYFNFVGRFVPPAFGEVELTPEELEEIRKREERKDRLHQNYLKRKASGAQKRYEDKIKKRKNAEIEAKKAAIRAEDIAKGVFVPVSSLPQREPQKGTQIA